MWHRAKPHKQLPPRLLNGQYQPPISRRLTFLKNPLIGGFVISLVSLLGGGLLGFLLPHFLNPEMANQELPRPAWLAPLGLYLLAGTAVLALLFLARRKLAPRSEWLVGKFNLSFLDQVQAMTKGPGVVVELTYAPLFRHLNLDSQKASDLIMRLSGRQEYQSARTSALSSNFLAKSRSVCTTFASSPRIRPIARKKGFFISPSSVSVMRQPSFSAASW